MPEELKCFKMFQDVSRCFKMFQDVSRCFKMFQVSSAKCATKAPSLRIQDATETLQAIVDRDKVLPGSGLGCRDTPCAVQCRAMPCRDALLGQLGSLNH